MKNELRQVPFILSILLIFVDIFYDYCEYNLYMTHYKLFNILLKVSLDPNERLRRGYRKQNINNDWQPR